MAPREELVSSAVNFLQDPSVASSPVEKRIEFLKSKNLTQEEIDVSLARANDDNSPQYAPQPQNQPYYTPQQYRKPPPGYNYNPYDWQSPPPDVPKRDWRDWFIMATVVGGAGYGLWVLTQRYVKPLIAPPTPPQLEQDKAAIDEQFTRAFALLDTLSSDTAALKEAEETRTQRLDIAISDVEAIVAELKNANSKREDDARRMESEIKSIKDSLPRAIDSVRDSSDKQLRELSNELGSLKLLMGNRMGVNPSNPYTPPMGGNFSSRQQPSDSITNARSGSSTPAAETAPGSSSNVTGTNSAGVYPAFAAPGAPFTGSTSAAASSTAARPKSTTPFGSASGKAAIPAWQMAAANKAKDFQIANPPPGPAVNGSSASSQPADGADAVAALSAS